MKLSDYKFVIFFQKKTVSYFLLLNFFIFLGNGTFLKFEKGIEMNPSIFGTTSKFRTLTYLELEAY